MTLSIIYTLNIFDNGKYKSTSEIDIWKKEMTNRIDELIVRLEEQQEELQKYSEDLITIMKILGQKMERDNIILEDLISTTNNKYLEQEELNKIFFNYMLYK